MPFMEELNTITSGDQTMNAQMHSLHDEIISFHENDIIPNYNSLPRTFISNFGDFMTDFGQYYSRYASSDVFGGSNYDMGPINQYRQRLTDFHDQFIAILGRPPSNPRPTNPDPSSDPKNDPKVNIDLGKQLEDALPWIIGGFFALQLLEHFMDRPRASSVAPAPLPIVSNPQAKRAMIPLAVIGGAYLLEKNRGNA